MKYKTISSRTNLYFTTSVITRHKNIFFTNDICSVPLEPLNWLRKNNFLKLFAFCLMPNHLHIVLKTINDNSIENILKKFHSFTAHEIVKFLKRKRNETILTFFKNAAFETKSDREYLIWQDSFVRIIESEKVLIELIEYTHNNPVIKKWRLVDKRSDYKFSSACYYDLGLEPLIPIDHVGELF